MSNAFKALQHLRQNPGRRLDQDDSDPQYASPAQSQQSRRLGRTSAGEPINQSGHVWGSMKRRTTDTTATTSNDSSIGYAIVPENHVSNDAAAFIRISSITIPQDSSDQPGRIEDNGMGNSTENLVRQRKKASRRQTKLKLLWILLLVVLAAPPLLNFIAYLEVHNETRESKSHANVQPLTKMYFWIAFVLLAMNLTGVMAGALWIYTEHWALRQCYIIVAGLFLLIYSLNFVSQCSEGHAAEIALSFTAFVFHILSIILFSIICWRSKSNERINSKL